MHSLRTLADDEAPDDAVDWEFVLRPLDDHDGDDSDDEEGMYRASVADGGGGGGWSGGGGGGGGGGSAEHDSTERIR